MSRLTFEWTAATTTMDIAEGVESSYSASNGMAIDGIAVLTGYL